MVIAFPFRGWMVPAGQLTIDRSNPITKDMIGAFIPGKNFNDYVWPDVASFADVGGHCTFPHGPYGPELAGDGANTINARGQLYVKNQRLSGQANWSIFAIAKILSGNFTTTGAGIYCERAAAGNDIVKMDYDSNGGGVNKLEITIRNDAATLVQVTNTGTANDNLYHSWCGTKLGAGTNNVKLYKDSVFNNQGSWNTNDTMTNAAIRVTVGYDVQDPSGNLPGSIVVVLTFTRALGVDEIQSLHLNPFQVFMPAEGEMPTLRAPSGTTTISGWNSNISTSMRRSIEIVGA